MSSEITILLWTCGFVGIMLRAWYGKPPVGGLALCYWLNLASVHLVTEGLCLFYRNTSHYRAASEYGFPLTAYAILGLMAGNFFIAPWLGKILPGRAPSPQGSGDPLADMRMAQVAIPFGLVIFLFGHLLDIPSFSSVTVSGNMLSIAGFIWWWWILYRSGQGRLAWVVLAGSLAIPALILGLRGFLSFGVFALLALMAVFIVRYRSRAVITLAAAPVLYLMLSGCVTYLLGRGDIRRSVWMEEADMSARAQVIAQVFSERWHWFDPRDERQRLALDARFDQNYFLGLAALRIDNGQMAYAQGETFTNAALALVPRILWRNKPVFVGGSEMMSRFTGLRFSAGTTFGLGHVLEAYANYGILGLVICFAVLGAAIGVIDLRVGMSMQVGDFESFLKWFIPGTALLNGSVGSFPELTGGLAGSIVLVWGYLAAFRVVMPPAMVPLPLARR